MAKRAPLIKLRLPKVRIGVSVEEPTLLKFRQICKKQGLELSPVINELMKYFISLEEKLDNE